MEPEATEGLEWYDQHLQIITEVKFHICSNWITFFPWLLTLSGVSFCLLSIARYDDPGQDKHRPGQDRPGGPVRHHHGAAEGEVCPGPVDRHGVASVDNGDALHLYTINIMKLLTRSDVLISVGSMMGRKTFLGGHDGHQEVKMTFELEIRPTTSP